MKIIGITGDSGVGKSTLALYIELTAKGHCKCMKWDNIKSLLNLAVVNKRLNRQQADYLKEKFCRE